MGFPEQDETSSDGRSELTLRLSVYVEHTGGFQVICMTFSLGGFNPWA